MPKNCKNKLCKYEPGKKVWLNKKNIKTKRNLKLEIKFFRPFHIFHLVDKLTYMFGLPTKWKIYSVFYLSLLEQNMTRKGQVNKFLQLELEFTTEKDKEYKPKAIRDNVIYNKTIES